MAHDEASSTSSSWCRSSYQVFLSFRGADTRHTFTDHLYTALIEAGIHTFRDDDEIERGDDIKKELDKAIHQSKAAVIVFSPSYASSRWCLDELVMINNRRKDGLLGVLSIFYHVDPSQVRWQQDSYDIAFAKHEKHMDKDHLERWRAALKEVVGLGGMVLKNDQFEAQFIRNVIKHVRNIIDHKPLAVEPRLFGIDSHLQDINLWLQDGETNVRMLILHGTGGVGKTTIAKTVYNHNYGNFEGSCFLANVRQTSEQPNGLLRLQKQFLSQILKGKSSKIYNVDEGIMRIKDAICCKKVLIVLDDVDHLNQFRAFLGMKEWLFPGSKIILTTRYNSFFSGHEGCWILPIEPLNHNDSLKLFSFHAFGQGIVPNDNLRELLECVVRYCGGLPLALVVLAASLFGTNIDVWESRIQELQAIPHDDIFNILKISYDSLRNDLKELFLHIACFFIGMEKDVVVQILGGCGFQYGFQHLIDRSLIEISDFNMVGMHQLLRDMGREIVRQESPEDPGKRSRVWHHKEAISVLTEKTGTKKIKGLVLEEDKSIRDGFFIPSLLGHVIETKAFANMHQLKLLQLSNVEVKGGYEDFPKRLVWLCWDGFPLKSIPTNFYLGKLVVLNMSRSSLQEVWQGKRSLPCLKILDLSYSNLLATTPDFHGLPVLERLIFRGCKNLIKINESIGILGKLVSLDLTGCIKLKKLPRTIGQLNSLKELYLIGCSDLEGLPKELAEIKTLSEFDASGINLNKTRKLGWLSTFQLLLLGREGPESTSSFTFDFLPRSLTSLKLSNCNLSDDAFPKDFSLPSLMWLDLSGNAFLTIPKELFGAVPSLKRLDLGDCSNLRYLPELPDSATVLNLMGCPTLARLPNFWHVTGGVTLLGCKSLADVGHMFSYSPGDLFPRMIHIFCMFDKYYLQHHLEFEMLNNVAWKKIITPFKVLYEFGIFSFFQPGSDVPSWYKYQDEGSSLSFVVDEMIVGLHVCFVYESTYNWDTDRSTYVYVFLKSKIRKLALAYAPTFFALGVKPAAGRTEASSSVSCKDILMVSCWNLIGHLGAGDEVTVNVRTSPDIQVKRVGVHILGSPSFHEFTSGLPAVRIPGENADPYGCHVHLLINHCSRMMSSNKLEDALNMDRNYGERFCFLRHLYYGFRDFWDDNAPETYIIKG